MVKDVFEAFFGIVSGWGLYKISSILYVMGDGLRFEAEAAFWQPNGWFTPHVALYLLVLMCILGVLWESQSTIGVLCRRMLIGFFVVSFCNFYYNSLEHQYWNSQEWKVRLNRQINEASFYGGIPVSIFKDNKALYEAKRGKKILKGI